MAASFFSNEQSSGKEAGGKPAGISMMTRTMEDDLKDARSGKSETEPAVQQEAQKNISQNPVLKKTANPFSEEGKKILESQTPVNTESSDNPFGVVSSPKSSFVSTTPKQPSLESGLSGIVLDKGVVITQPEKGHKTLWVSVIVIIVLAAAIGASYFFFFSQVNQTETVTPSPSPANDPNEAAEIVPETLPFALDKPNYLSFNTETVSADDIRSTLSQTSLRIKDAGISQPVEFLVTDQNNNPLAFSRFSFLLKLDIAPELLALADETFSLYVYNDAGSARLGLMLTFKDAAAVAPVLTKVENTLPYAFQTLILEPGVVVAKNIPFRSSTYNAFAIRFANVNSDKNVSFDYMLRDTKWFIGTSKNTLRAILDAYAK